MNLLRKYTIWLIILCSAAWLAGFAVEEGDYQCDTDQECFDKYGCGEVPEYSDASSCWEGE
jgi:hypothetical protein